MYLDTASAMSYLDRIFTGEQGVSALGVNSFAPEDAPPTKNAALISFTDYDSFPSQAWWLRLRRLFRSAWMQSN